MKTNYIYMAQINHKANRALSEVEKEKEIKQKLRSSKNKRKVKAQKEKSAFTVAIMVIMLIGIYFGTDMIISKNDIPTYNVETEEMHYVPDRYTVKGKVIESTETGCLIETFEELDGHIWYWEFDDTQYYVGEIVTMEMDRCSVFVEDYEILKIY